MNRLVLLGNGFDLAHDMKTSYYDFIYKYLNQCFLHADYTDDLIDVRRNPEVEVPRATFFSSVSSFLSFEVNRHNEYLKRDDGNPKAFRLRSKSQFVSSILNDCCDHNWVNIETKYYSALKNILNTHDMSFSKTQRLEFLNSSMACLIKHLDEYIKQQTSASPIPGYRTILNQEIVPEEFLGISHFSTRPEKTMILNFNYTTTVEQYSNLIGEQVFVNYIHGCVNDGGNPIIFGFGDEMDEDYKRIESERERGFLSYMKSFGYFKTSNYHDLIRFIDSDQFQVFILGHSCGLSDRTMLNMIFEHINCISIKVFYHKTERHFRELTEEISRHFKDKSSMRRKIVPFRLSMPMPQASNLA